MTSQLSSPLKPLFPSQPSVNLPHGSVSARHDLQLVVTLPHGPALCSQSENDNLLKTQEFDICIYTFDARKRDFLGKSGAESKEYTADPSRNSVRYGILYEDDIFGHRGGCEDEGSRAKMRESYVDRSDRIRSEDGTVEEAGQKIDDPRQDVIYFGVVYDETHLLAEAKRLREKNQSASSDVAQWIAAELLRIAIAAAQVSI